MFPEEFKNRISHQKYLDADALLNALNRPSPDSIRLNPAKWTRLPGNSEQVPWCSHGWYLETRPLYTLDPLFHSGCYYPQEASSMFIGEVFKQITGGMKNIKVLDLCGAPGGKSTHISTIIGDKGVLIANDVIGARASILSENLTKWGAGNTIVTRNDPSAFSKLERYFDLILVDAPCSGEGMFRDPEVVREWTPANAAMCIDRQKRILMNVWPALKDKGILIYSTCTFNPGENEENIKWFVDKMKAETVNLYIEQYQGIQEIKYDGVSGYGFYPYKIKGEGFFIAVIRKPGSAGDTFSEKKKIKKLYLSKKDLSVAERWSDSTEGHLLRHSDVVYALAVHRDDFLILQKNLKIIKGGVVLFTAKRKDYLPSHELALSQLLIHDAFPTIELDIRQAISYLKRDNLILNDAPEGWIILSYKGVSMGFVKNIGSRINNYFPIDWRIRMNIPPSGKNYLIEWKD